MQSAFIFPTETDLAYVFRLTDLDGAAYAGQLDIKCHVSDTDSGAIITGMTAVAAAETATAGTYKAVFPVAASRTGITSRRWEHSGFVCAVQDGKILASDECVFAATVPAGIS